MQKNGINLENHVTVGRNWGSGGNRNLSGHRSNNLVSGNIILVNNNFDQNLNSNDQIKTVFFCVIGYLEVGDNGHCPGNILRS